MKMFGERVMAFNRKINFPGSLPDGIHMMNPYRDSPEALALADSFYKKFYHDNRPRHLILGINPGRFGGGHTGIPFTDTKRLVQDCGLQYAGRQTHEPSSAFIYEMIRTYGGAELFYRRFYISSICPLGFTSRQPGGKEVNYNYYDSKALLQSVYDFIINNIREQIRLGVSTDIIFCFGTGKNEKFLRAVNEEFRFFRTIIPLEHPRFIMQYKSATKQLYIDKYLRAFTAVDNH